MATVRLGTDATGVINIAFRYREDMEQRRYSGAEAPPLVCCAEVQDLKSPKLKGQIVQNDMVRCVQFTRLAKRTVREAGAAMELACGRNIVFLTGTLPGGTREALRGICNASAYIYARVRQWIRDTAHGAYTVAVWELQKRGALHLHVAVGHANRKMLARIRAGFRRFWLKLLLLVSRRMQVDLFARAQGGTWSADWRKCRTDAQYVKKSVAQYLAKYLSKGSNSQAHGETFSPVSWWGISRNLRDLMGEHRQAIEIGRLAPAGVAQIAEKIGGWIVARVPKVFPVRNEFEPGYLRLVICPNAIESLQVFRELKLLLECAVAFAGESAGRIRSSAGSILNRSLAMAHPLDVAAFFSGAVLT